MTPQNSTTYFWAVYGPASLAYPAGDKLPPSRFERTDPLQAPAVMVVHPDATTPAVMVVHPDATTPAVMVVHPDATTPAMSTMPPGTSSPQRITVGHLLDVPPPAAPGASLQKGDGRMRIRFGPFHATAEIAAAAMEGEWPELAAQGALYAELCRLDTEFAQ